MSERDVCVVRRMFEAFATRDVDRVLSFADPAVTFRAGATAELAGRSEPYRGHEGIRLYFQDVARIWDELRVEPLDFRAVAGSVVIFGRAEGRAAGQEIRTGVIWTWRLRDGLLVAGSVFSTADAGAESGDEVASVEPPTAPG